MIPISYYRDKCFHFQFQGSSKVVMLSPQSLSGRRDMLPRVACTGYTSHFMPLTQLSSLAGPGPLIDCQTRVVAGARRPCKEGYFLGDLIACGNLSKRNLATTGRPLLLVWGLTSSFQFIWRNFPVRREEPSPDRSSLSGRVGANDWGEPLFVNRDLFIESLFCRYQ